MKVQRFELAGFPFEVGGPAALVERLGSAWRAFVPGVGVSARARARIEVEVTGPAVPEPVMQLVLPSLPQPDADGVSRVAGPGFEAVLRADGRCEVRGLDALFPVDVMVRLLLGRDLAARGGVLVHGVGIAEPHPGGRAMLFTGDSGAGKSTLGRCAEAGGLVRISDELVAVEPTEGGGFVLHGTPWNIGIARSASLSHVGTLQHAQGDGEKDTCDGIPPSELMRVLLGNVLLAEESPAGRAQLLRHVTSLLRAVPSIRLTFAPRPQVADALRSAWR